MWYYNKKEFNETPEEFQGFVYIITNINTGKKYVGKRTFGNLKFSPKQKHVKDGFEQELSPIGEIILVRTKN